MSFKIEFRKFIIIIIVGWRCVVSVNIKGFKRKIIKVDAITIQYILIDYDLNITLNNIIRAR